MSKKSISFDDLLHDTAVKILREYVDVKDINQSKPIEILPMTIIDMIIEFQERFNDELLKHLK